MKYGRMILRFLCYNPPDNTKQDFDTLSFKQTVLMGDFNESFYLVLKITRWNYYKDAGRVTEDLINSLLPFIPSIRLPYLSSLQCDAYKL